MGYIYHGSRTHGIKRMEPKKSTHGVYVYGTPHKALALHFGARAGDDFTYALGHFGTPKDSPWELVELIPGGLERMYDNSASIYSISDQTFEDLHTGFAEVVSKVGVDVVSEEKVDNVYEAILQLEKEGAIKIYRYPDRPKGFPADSSHLIDKLRRYEKLGHKTTKEDLERLFCLHPYLMEKINAYAEEKKLGVSYSKRDLIKIFGNNVKKQLLSRKKDQEFYIESSYKSIIETFPELTVAMDQLYGRYRYWADIKSSLNKLL